MQEVHIIKKKKKMKCKYHNTKFTPKYFNQNFCLSDDECIKAFNEFVKAEKEKQRVKQWQKEKKVIKTPNLGNLRGSVNLLRIKQPRPLVRRKWGSLGCKSIL